MMIERWRNKRSSEDVRWRSFLRWGTVKVKLLETNAPQKIWWSDFRRTDFSKKIIDGESSKAELLQSSKSLSGNMI